MKEGIPYAAIPDMCRRNGGFIAINPLARWGQSRIWKAVKRAKRHGLVSVERPRIDLAIARPVEVKP